MNTNEHKSPDITPPTLTEIIIGCALKVHNTLGAGFLEKVYENALVHELRKAGAFVEQQKSIPVYYDGILVGDYIADLVVNHKVIIELKTAKALAEEFTAICLNYLRSAALPICLLFNFAKPRLEWRRLVGEAYANEPHPL
jgi:GxxExxY protein